MTFAFGTYSINGDLYARGLGQMLRTTRLYDPDRALATDPEVYERLRRDPVVSFAVRLRKLLASGTDWFLEPASPREEDRRVLQIMEALLKNINHFGTSRFNLSEAIISGSRWSHIEGEQKECQIARLPVMNWWVPTHLRDVDKRRMRQMPVPREMTHRQVKFRDGGGNLVEQTVPFVVKEWVWQVYRPLNQQWEDIDRDDYIRHVYDDREDTLGFGGGLASEIYTYWYAKEVALQYGLQYLERWAQGLVVAMVDSLRDGMPSNPSSAQRMSDWLTQLKKMRSEHVMVADAKDRLDIHDAPTGGWQAVREALDYLDGSIRVCILGSSLPTEKNVKGGSYAMADVQQGVSDLLARFDRNCAEETLRRDLLGWCWRKNYAIFKSLGLERCNLPYFRIREDRREDHEVRANVLLKVRQAGMEIRRDEAYAQTGFSPPAKGDEILPTLGQSESQRQEGQPKGEASGAGAAFTKPGGAGVEAANPGRPFEEKGNAGKPREQGADAKARGFEAESVERFMEQLEKFSGERTIKIEMPPQPAPVVNVNVPKQEPQKAPVVNVQPAQVNVPAPVVNVNVPPAKTPIVNVAAPKVNVEAPTVNVAAPSVHPTFNVAAPEVNVDVAAPNVTITPPAKKDIEIKRDAYGRVSGAQVKSEPTKE